MNKNQFLFLLLVLGNLLSFSQQEKFTLVTLGSSTLGGKGVTTYDSSWVRIAEREWQKDCPNFELVNLARGYQTTYDILPVDSFVLGKRSPNPLTNIEKALSYFPNAILINLPSNDAAFGYSVSEQMYNYKIVADICSLNNIPLWICTTQPRNLDANGNLDQKLMKDSLEAVYKENAIDFWTTVALENGNIDPVFGYDNDGIHLNNLGHKILAERAINSSITGFIKEKCALSIQEASLSAKSQTYPNPVRENLFFISDCSTQTELDIRIIEVSTSKVVLDSKYSLDFMGQEIDIDISSLQIGVYLLDYKTCNQTRKTFISKVSQ